MKKASIIAKLGAAAMAAVMACSSIAASAATVPNATIDTTRKTSLELYKYDFTTAHEDGKLNTDSYVSTGLPDDAVETALADYAIQGVVFTYTKVADVTTYSALEADGYKDMVLYAMPDNAKTAQFLAALGLSAADAYRTDGGNLFRQDRHGAGPLHPRRDLCSGERKGHDLSVPRFSADDHHRR